MNYKNIKKAPLVISIIILILSFIVFPPLFYASAFSYLISLVLIVILLILTLGQPWQRHIKIVVILTFIALVFAIPMYPYSNTCTTQGFSYINPIGFSTSDTAFRLCGMALTDDIFFGHYLLTDLAILGWISIFIRKVLIKKRLIV